VEGEGRSPSPPPGSCGGVAGEAVSLPAFSGGSGLWGMETFEVFAQ
jgi:hypothetical protein